jgi:hypothetical protein
MTEHTTYGPDCLCRQAPPVHEDDSYGACTICREWVPHTEDEYVTVPFPCAVVRADKAEAALAALADANHADEQTFYRVKAERDKAEAALDSAQARARSTMVLYQAAVEMRDAAREDAERLYKALRTRQCLCTATHPGTCVRCAALAAHDALVGPYDTVRMTEEPTP